MIALDDRISAVLERDEGLVDVLTAFSPHFEKLRNPHLRRVMGRLVTVGQAAAIAGVDPDALLDALNGRSDPSAGARRSGAAPDLPASDATRHDAAEGSVATPSPRPQPGSPTAPDGAMDFLSSLPPSRIIDVDVREDLRAGREPFARIMAAVGQLHDDSVLRLRAIFDPVPLYAVLGKRGLMHLTECLAPDDWQVWFYSPAVAEGWGGGEQSEAGPVGAVPVDADAGDVRTGAPRGTAAPVYLDVRGLEPPEPMVRTLAALEDLPPDGVLVQTNVRVPRFLIEELDRRGFHHEVRVISDNEVRVTIRRQP